MKLYRAFATVGGLTLLSRVLGFLRDILLRQCLARARWRTRFYVAFRFPNLFRRLFGEGAFNSAFVPLFREIRRRRSEKARAFASEAMSGLTFVLVLLSAAAMLAMPWLMYLLAPGFSDTPEKFDLAVLLTQITFPYLLCMSLVALLSGVLNTFGKFVESSSVSIVLNLRSTVAMLRRLRLGLQGRARRRHRAGEGRLRRWHPAALAPHRGSQAQRLDPEARRPRWTEDMKTPRRARHSGRHRRRRHAAEHPIGTVIASLQDGAVSHLYYADRLYELPLAIVGIAIGVVLLPDVSRHLRAGNHAAVMDSQNRSLEFAMLLTVPGRGRAGRRPDGDRAGARSSAAPSPPPTRRTPRRRSHLRARAARLRNDQGVLAGLLRPPGYEDTDALRGLEPDREHHRVGRRCSSSSGISA